MQIDNNVSVSSLNLGPTTSGSPKKGVSFQNAGGDQVQISSLASQLSSDPSKLSQLQASYEAGTYSVSPAQIANSILKDAMLSRL